MKRALVGIALALASALVFRAEMSTAAYLLRLSILRQGLLNHELASSLLERRLWAIQTDAALNAELRNFVAESTVFSADRLPAGASIQERLGIPIVNFVRLLGLKPLLGIDADRTRLEEMQSAFVLERTKRIREAEEIYAGLEGRFSSGSEDRAFVLLHRAYCLLLLGRTKDSQSAAHLLIREQPGTHYARSAAVLLDFLARQEELVEIAGRSTDQAERGRYFFLGGAFGRSADEYSRAERLAVEDRLRYARALEETGQVKDAARLLEDVARDPSPSARSANERLLLIGHFLGGGETIRRAAVERAERLGQNDLVSKVETAVVLQAPVKSVAAEPEQTKSKEAPQPRKDEKAREQTLELERVRSKILARPSPIAPSTVFEVTKKVVPDGINKQEAVIEREKAALVKQAEKLTNSKSDVERLAAGGPRTGQKEKETRKPDPGKADPGKNENTRSDPGTDKKETKIPIAGAGLIVLLIDGRKIYADEVRLKGDAVTLVLRGAVIEIPTAGVQSIQPGSGVLEIQPRIGRAPQSITVREGRFQAVSGSSFFPLQGTESIRPADQ